MFDPDQDSFDRGDSFWSGKEFGWSMTAQDLQRRRKPMCSLLLVAEHGNRVCDNRHNANDHAR